MRKGIIHLCWREAITHFNIFFSYRFHGLININKKQIASTAKVGNRPNNAPKKAISTVRTAIKNKDRQLRRTAFDYSEAVDNYKPVIFK